MSHRKPPPPRDVSPYAGPLTRANVSLDPRDQRTPPHEQPDPWTDWQRHVDAGRIGEGAGEREGE